MVPHSKKLQPVAVQGHRVLLKPMFQKAKHLNSFSHLSVGSRDGEKSSSPRRWSRGWAAESDQSTSPDPALLGKCITWLPSPCSLPKTNSKTHPKIYTTLRAGSLNTGLRWQTEVLAPEMMESHLPPAAIPKAHENQPEHKLLFISFSIAALTASIGAGFQKRLAWRNKSGRQGGNRPSLLPLKACSWSKD